MGEIIQNGKSDSDRCLPPSDLRRGDTSTVEPARAPRPKIFTVFSVVLVGTCSFYFMAVHLMTDLRTLDGSGRLSRLGPEKVSVQDLSQRQRASIAPLLPDPTSHFEAQGTAKLLHPESPAIEQNNNVALMHEEQESDPEDTVNSDSDEDTADPDSDEVELQSLERSLRPELSLVEDKVPLIHEEEDGDLERMREEENSGIFLAPKENDGSGVSKHYEFASLSDIDDEGELKELDEPWMIQTYNHTGSIKYYSSSNDSWRSTADVVEHPVQAGHPDYTLLLQSSTERASLLRRHCQRWQGPMSIVLYTTETAHDVPVNDYIPEECQRRSNIVVFQGGKDQKYPVNQLRNIALQEAGTSHVFTCDIDFLPDVSLYRRLRALGARAAAGAGGGDGAAARHALVVPAFSFAEWHGSCWGAAPAAAAAACERLVAQVPATYAGLGRCLQGEGGDGEGKAAAAACQVFDRRNPGGHSTTEYPKWYRQRHPQLRKVPCFHTNRYEPYFAMRKHRGMPLYDERFVGYGKNKIQYVVHLRHLGWEFFVVPQSYIIHAPHPKSNAKREWSAGEKKKTDSLYAGFLKSMMKIPKSNIKTRACQQKPRQGKKQKKS